MKQIHGPLAVSALLLFLAPSVFAAKAASPAFNPSPGAFAGSVTVTISTATSGATIRYTTDGTIPSATSPLYTGPLTFTSTTTLSARAFLSGIKASLATSGVYTITQAVSAPVFSPSQGIYAGSVTVTIFTSTSGATIRYTTNGNVPTSSSSVYTAPLNITSTTTLKARAFKSGLAESDVTTGVYTIRTVVYLLLHGLSSTPSTWDDLVRNELGGTCAEVAFPLNSFPVSGCYRYLFATRRSVDGEEWERGDGSTFDQLGSEVTTVVQKISDTVNPAVIVLVGHSRGGLAARAYLQSLSSTPPFKLSLLTIGTPHQGTPLGRMKVWMDQHQYTSRDVNILIRAQTRFLFSPSTGFLATDHDRKKKPKRTSISAAIFALNDGAPSLGGKASVFGQIVSTGLRLGENAAGPLDLLDGTSVAAFLPGDFNDMKNFVLLNLPDDWRNDGDGIVPANSQRLTQLPGFSSPAGVLSTTLVKVSHTDETSQTAAIKRMLDTMLQNLHLSVAPSAEGSIPRTAQVANESAQQLESRMNQAAHALSGKLSGEVIKSLVQAMRDGDDYLLNAAMENVLARFRQGDDEPIQTIIDELPRCSEGEAALMISLLGRMPSERSVEALLTLAVDSNPGIRQAALAGISGIGKHADQDGLADNLAALLSERLLSRAFDGDPELIESVSSALSTIGTEKCVETLLQFLEIHEDAPQAWRVVATGLKNLRNTAGIVPLGSHLRRDPELSQRLTRVSTDTLATMGSPESTRILLRWASRLTQEGLVERAATLLSQIRDTRSLELLFESLKSTPFRSPQLKERLETIAHTLEKQITPVMIGTP